MHNKCLGVFLVFLTFPFIILTILNFSFFRNFTSSNFYKIVLSQSNAYQETSNLVQKTYNPSETNILTMLSQSINSGWLKTNTEQNLDGLFSFLNGQTPQANLSIDLTSLKNNLKPTTDAPEEVIAIIPNQLTIDSYKTFLTNLEQVIKKQSAGDAISSQLAGQDIANVQNQLQNANNISGQYQNNLNNIKRGFMLSKIFGYVILGLTLLMLLFIALAARRDVAGIFRWIGNALVYPGAVMSAFFYILSKGKPTCIKVISSLNTSLEVKNTLEGVAGSAIQKISHDGMIIAFSVFGAGILLIIISYFISGFRKKTPPLAQQPVPVVK